MKRLSQRRFEQLAKKAFAASVTKLKIEIKGSELIELLGGYAKAREAEEILNKMSRLGTLVALDRLPQGIKDMIEHEMAGAACKNCDKKDECHKQNCKSDGLQN